jgi:hypothetical protein
VAVKTYFPEKSPRPPLSWVFKVAAGRGSYRHASIYVVPVLERHDFRLSWLSVPYIKMTLGTLNHPFVGKRGFQ